MEIEKLEEILQISFKDKDLLEKSLTHRSYINENRGEEAKHNERLEFLGDAVLELLVTEKLFADYPDYPEGILTSIRSATVRTETLADASRKLNYGKYIRMSVGEEETGGRDRNYILANTFEAVLGAIYLDQGYEVCKEFMYRTLFTRIEGIIENEDYIDAKSKLQELIQEKVRITPHYELVSEDGPDHEKIFTMAIMVGDEKVAEGSGKSKQLAEQEAAKAAIEVWEKK